MINPKWGQDSIDAPIDGYMISKKPKNKDGRQGARRVPRHCPGDRHLPQDQLGQPRRQQAARTRRGTSPLQKKAAKLIARAKNIAQYMDRDTRPDFASTVMIPSLQSVPQQPERHQQRSSRASRSRRRRSSDRELACIGAMATDIATSVRGDGARKRKRAVRLSTRDRVAIAVMVGIPVIVTGGLIWFPTISSIGLSFTNWDGIGGLQTIHWAGTTNYRQIATIYPPFWPAFRHNLYWLGALAFVGYAVRDAARLPARQADPRLAVLPEHLLHPGRDRARDHRPHHRSWSCRPSRALSAASLPIRGTGT